MIQVKEKDLFETIGRGVVVPKCKLCGAVVHDTALHTKWHNKSGV